MSSNEYAKLRARHLHHIREAIPDHQQRIESSPDQIKDFSTQALRSLLRQAREHSPWHGERLKRLAVDEITSEKISELPLMTKEDIRENWDRIVTDRALTQAKVADYLKKLTEPSYLNERYLAFASGGSSGKRGVYVWDWEVFTQFASLNFRYQYRDDRQAGRIGKRRLKAVVTAGKPNHGSTPLFSVNLDPTEAVKVYSVLRPFDEIAKEIDRDQPDQLIGYSSVIGRLAEESLAGRIKIAPYRVSTNSEPLMPEIRKVIRQAWACKINNTWGSTETAMNAVECDAQEGMHLSEDRVLIEPVDEANRPVPEGQLSEKVLITVLFNHSFPIIRYELTDKIRVLKRRCSCGAPFRLIEDIQGRSDDEFTYSDGTRIHPILFRAVLGQNPHIYEYQVQQTQKGAHILLMGDLKECGETLEKIRTHLEHHGLHQARVTGEVVPEIPRHRETGKLKRFVPL